MKSGTLISGEDIMDLYDLYIEKGDSDQPFFKSFITSNVVVDSVKKRTRSIGLDIFITGYDGEILIPPEFLDNCPQLLSDSFRGFIKSQVSDKISNLEFTDFHIEGQAGYHFIFLPIITGASKNRQVYLAVGPFHLKDRVIVENSVSCPGNYDFLDYLTNHKKIKAKTFSPESYDLLIELLKSLANFIDKLFREKMESQKRLNRLSGLYEINTSVTRTLDMEKVLQVVLDKAIDLLGAEKGSIMLLDRDSQQLSILVAHGLSPEIVKNTRIKLGESIAGKVAAGGKPVLLRKGEKASHYDTQKNSSKLLSAMSVPLKTRGEIIGVLNISGRKGGGNFTSEDLDLAEALAANAAAAIENARLYQQVQLKYLEMEALLDLSSTIVSTLQRREVLQKILDNAIKLLQASDGSLMLINHEKNVLEIEVAYGLSPEVIEQTKIPLGEGIAGKVALEGKPKLMKRGVKVADSCSEGEQGKFPSALSVPMKYQGRVIGVLNVKGKTRGKNFNNFDMELLSMLASQAAIAIENSRLYDQVQTKLEEQGALFDLGTTIVSTLNRREVLEKILDNAIKLLHARDGSLMLLDKKNKVLEIEVAHGLPEKVVNETRIKLGEGIAGKVALEGKPRLLKRGKKEVNSDGRRRCLPLSRNVQRYLSSPVPPGIFLRNVPQRMDRTGSLRFSSTLL